jgi:hypothetical protein
VVGVFDAAISLRASQLAISAQAIELEQPVLEARGDVKLSGTDFIRVRIPGNGCFCPGAASGSTDGQNLLQRRFWMRVVVDLSVYDKVYKISLIL